jgi:hypothetical protein
VPSQTAHEPRSSVSFLLRDFPCRDVPQPSGVPNRKRRVHRIHWLQHSSEASTRSTLWAANVKCCLYGSAKGLAFFPLGTGLETLNFDSLLQRTRSKTAWHPQQLRFTIRVGGQSTKAEMKRGHPGVSWPAVFAGAFVAAALSLILLALGTGIGLSAVSPWASARASGSEIGKGAIGWFILTQLIASSMGGHGRAG